MFKKLFALILAGLMILGCFTACGTAEPDVTIEPAGPTQPEEEAKVLKVLTLGHSLAVDCGNALNRVFYYQGIGDYEEVYIGTLYYSGCPIYKHVNFMTANSPEYSLYLSSTKTPDQPPTIMKDVTMKDAVSFEYWDIIIMQGGVFEIAKDTTFTDGKIQQIQEYVLQYTHNPAVYFAWHMAWATPTNNELRDKYPYDPNSYYVSYTQFDDNRDIFYQNIARCVGEYIVPDDTFKFLIPSGTALENALTSYLEETDLHRDYAHASDFGRIIASYTWYCAIMGIDKLDEVKLETVPVNFLKNTSMGELVLTQAQKDMIIESVNNALANPLEVTQSQYTEAPAAE